MDLEQKEFKQKQSRYHIIDYPKYFYIVDDELLEEFAEKLTTGRLVAATMVSYAVVNKESLSSLLVKDRSTGSGNSLQIIGRLFNHLHFDDVTSVLWIDYCEDYILILKAPSNRMPCDYLKFDRRLIKVNQLWNIQGTVVQIKKMCLGHSFTVVDVSTREISVMTSLKLRTDGKLIGEVSTDE